MKAALAALLLLSGAAARADTILFVGNSFTYGHGSPVMIYRPETVTDLNGEGIGGVPALFKSFTVEAGLDYQVALETHPGAPFAWHVEHKLDVVTARPWDHVVLQGYSMLDPQNPGDPTNHAAGAAALAQALRGKNPQVDVRVMATWARADQVYQASGHWHGKTIELMTADLRAGADKAAATDPAIKGVLPVGDAWIRAIHDGVADADPYDGIDAGKVDLWTYDNYHASTYGYYLEALVVFGGITGRDPRSLGATECSGFELGFSMDQVKALEKTASDQLTAAGLLRHGPGTPDMPRTCTGTVAECSQELERDLAVQDSIPRDTIITFSSPASPQRCGKPS